MVANDGRQSKDLININFFIEKKNSLTFFSQSSTYSLIKEGGIFQKDAPLSGLYEISLN